MIEDYFSIGTLPDNATHKDVVNEVYGQLSKNFITSYDYRKSASKKYKGKPLNKQTTKNIEFSAYSYYCYALGRYILEHGIELDENIAKEVRYYEFDKGGSCIYNSVLFIALLVEGKIIDAKNVKLVQGYYKHKLREDFPSWIPFGKNHYGMHAWSLIGKSVFDFCIVPQEQQFFDFKDDIMIDGIVPDGLDFYGFEEDYIVVRQYVDEILKLNNIGFEEWILKHRITAMELFSKELVESLKEI